MFLHHRNGGMINMAILRVKWDRNFKEISRELLPGPEPNLTPLVTHFFNEIIEIQKKEALEKQNASSQQCEKAKTFAKIAGSITLTRRVLFEIKELGFKVTFAPETEEI